MVSTSDTCIPDNDHSQNCFVTSLWCKLCNFCACIAMKATWTWICSLALTDKQLIHRVDFPLSWIGQQFFVSLDNDDCLELWSNNVQMCTVLLEELCYWPATMPLQSLLVTTCNLLINFKPFLWYLSHPLALVIWWWWPSSSMLGKLRHQNWKNGNDPTNASLENFSKRLKHLQDSL